MQLPLGQREASMAEHCPVQLMPLPQVTLVTVMSLSQQPTSIDSLENVKEESKKTTSVVLVVPGEKQEIVKQISARSHPGTPMRNTRYLLSFHCIGQHLQ